MSDYNFDEITDSNMKLILKHDLKLNDKVKATVSMSYIKLTREYVVELRLLGESGFDFEKLLVLTDSYTQATKCHIKTVYELTDDFNAIICKQNWGGILE